jgi:uncharacterized protein YmfQ (DUF2313 family)
MAAVDVEVLFETVISPDSVGDSEIITEDDFDAIVQHFPLGFAWVWAKGSNLWNLARGMAKNFGRVDTIERAVVRQLDPNTADFGLETWEGILGLDRGDLTDEERRTAIIAALRARGGQSITYWTELLESLGYENVVITPLSNYFRMGDRIRKRLQGAEWAYAFKISADSIPAFDDAMIEAVLASKRATTYVCFDLT